MYFYSTVLCLEGLLRLEHYIDLKDDIRVFMLKKLLWVPVIIFFFEFFVTSFYSAPNAIPFFEVIIQLGCGAMSFILSLCVHFLVISHEARRLT